MISRRRVGSWLSVGEYNFYIALLSRQCLGCCSLSINEKTFRGIIYADMNVAVTAANIAHRDDERLRTDR